MTNLNPKMFNNDGEHNFEDISKPKDEVMPRTWVTSLATAVFYGICSFSMTFINKIVVSSYAFNYPFFIMSCEMMVTILFLEVLRLCGLITISSYSFEKGWSFFWPTLFFSIYSISALRALSGMTIPMYGAIKRCTPLATFVLSIIIFRKKIPSTYVCVSICLITVGCIIAGIGDLSFDILAYTYGLISIITQALYLLLVQRSAENNISSLEILQLSCYNSVPFYMLLNIATQEYNNIEKFHNTDFGFLCCFFAQLIIGSVFNYSLFLCTTVNSALTTTLIGVLKSVFQTSIGFVTFGGISFHLLNVAGIILNICGGFIYTHAKYKEFKEKENQKTDEEESLLICHTNNDEQNKKSLNQGCKIYL